MICIATCLVASPLQAVARPPGPAQPAPDQHQALSTLQRWLAGVGLVGIVAAFIAVYASNTTGSLWMRITAAVACISAIGTIVTCCWILGGSPPLQRLLARACRLHCVSSLLLDAARPTTKRLVRLLVAAST